MNRRLILCFLAILIFLPCRASAGEYAIDVHARGKACPGTTLFAETMDPRRPKIVEVDMDGRVVWEYAVPQDIARGGRPGQAMDVEWIPDTDHILFVMPFKGIFEVDRQGAIVWRHLTDRVSHDADRLRNGNTLYTFAWEKKGDPEVTEITPNGDVVWQWIASDHIAPDQRRHKGAVDRDGFAHVNGATRLDNGLTRISLRNFFTAVEVDRNGDVAWSLSTLHNGRRVRYVHDPRTLPGDNLVLSTHAPQVILVTTREGQVLHKLKKPDIHLVRAHQALPNGNILVTDVDKIMELTPNLGKVVWQLSKRGVDTVSLSGPKPGAPRHNAPRTVDPRENGFYKARRIPAR
ncbi:MAG: aryl-sulfate sulfotransferase [Desulfovibrionaceae bacterium]|nr:aryl-sulfate sulfotransferase [Desulfovibrionaceae bacterium]